MMGSALGVEGGGGEVTTQQATALTHDAATLKVNYHGSRYWAVCDCGAECDPARTEREALDEWAIHVDEATGAADAEAAVAWREGRDE